MAAPRPDFDDLKRNLLRALTGNVEQVVGAFVEQAAVKFEAAEAAAEVSSPARRRCSPQKEKGQILQGSLSAVSKPIARTGTRNTGIPFVPVYR